MSHNVPIHSLLCFIYFTSSIFSFFRQLLEANHSATAVVKDQTCAAYAQYAGLQIAEANRTHSDRGFFGY